LKFSEINKYPLSPLCENSVIVLIIYVIMLTYSTLQ